MADLRLFLLSVALVVADLHTHVDILTVALDVADLHARLYVMIGQWH